MPTIAAELVDIIWTRWLFVVPACSKTLPERKVDAATSNAP